MKDDFDALAGMAPSSADLDLQVIIAEADAMYLDAIANYVSRGRKLSCLSTIDLTELLNAAWRKITVNYLCEEGLLQISDVSSEFKLRKMTVPNPPEAAIEFISAELCKLIRGIADQSDPSLLFTDNAISALRFVNRRYQ